MSRFLKLALASTLMVLTLGTCSWQADQTVTLTDAGQIFTIFYFAGFIVAAIVRGAYRRQTKGSKISEDRKTALDLTLMSLPFLGMFILPLVSALTPWLDFADYTLPGWVGWAGVVIYAAAQWLLWRSHADLGRNWTVTLQITEGHALVTQGVYRSIRHPMYAAHWLWAIAQPLLLQNWIAGPATLVTFLPLYLLRVPKEERMLLDQFGEAYRAYMRRTGRVIPVFWR